MLVPLQVLAGKIARQAKSAVDHARRGVRVASPSHERQVQTVITSKSLDQSIWVYSRS